MPGVVTTEVLYSSTHVAAAGTVPYLQHMPLAAVLTAGSLKGRVCLLEPRIAIEQSSSEQARPFRPLIIIINSSDAIATAWFNAAC